MLMPLSEEDGMMCVSWGGDYKSPPAWCNRMHCTLLAVLTVGNFVAKSFGICVICVYFCSPLFQSFGFCIRCTSF